MAAIFRIRQIGYPRLCSVLLLAVSGSFMRGDAQVLLTADGVVPAYNRITRVLAASPETPDCSHPAFGPHITQTVDAELQKYVFAFNIHVTPDNDRCINFDRQRLEIKTEGNASTPNYLKGFLGDSVSFRWKFKLPAGFQPSTSFTHIHQIKAYDGDADAPIITLTPRKSTPNQLQLIHVDSQGTSTTLTQTPLDPFVGIWVEAYEKITYGSAGKYSIVLTRRSDGATLFSYSNENLDLWRIGTTVVRPKWGIYRSLNHPEQLRDEQVLFDECCLAKGGDDCPSEANRPDFLLTSDGATGPITPGAASSFTIHITPMRGFTGEVAFQANGLPPGSFARFAPRVIQDEGDAVLTISSSSSTPAGNYDVIINGVSGVASHAITAALTIENPQ